MHSQERVRLVLAGEIPDRIPLDDGYWTTTVERWRREGLPADVSPQEYFGTDEIVRLEGDWSLQLPEEVLEEGPQMRLYWDDNGALRRDLHTDEGWTSQWLDYRIKTRQDWARYRERLAYRPSRIPAHFKDIYQRARAQGKAVFYAAHACFHPTWMRIGMVNELMWMLEDPEFIHDLFAAQVQVVLEIFEAMLREGMTFDAAFLADDLGYVAAPLISPALYRELVLPYHRRLCQHFAERGLKTILHSDGNVAPLIPGFLEAGFAGLHPLEVKAGLDMRTLKPLYGDRLLLYGNIDVRKLSGTKDEIEEEIASKIPLAKAGGGYIYHSDHSVPNSVSFENYRFAIERVKHYGAY